MTKNSPQAEDKMFKWVKAKYLISPWSSVVTRQQVCKQIPSSWSFSLTIWKTCSTQKMELYLFQIVWAQSTPSKRRSTSSPLPQTLAEVSDCTAKTTGLAWKIWSSSSWTSGSPKIKKTEIRISSPKMRRKFWWGQESVLIKSLLIVSKRKLS